MATDHVENEIKLEAPLEPAPVPQLNGLVGVGDVRVGTHTLEATYFDTADLRLAANRTTLRRRTGGPDEGWHLKRPLPDGARRETHLPIAAGGTEVPDELLAQVRAIVRHRPLVPVATIADERTVHSLVGTDGQVLAEVCDDHVRATAQAGPGADDGEQVWREWEVELVDGEPDVLDAVVERLVAAGATPSSSASKLQRTLGTDPAGRAPRKRGGLRRRDAGAVVWTYLADQVAELVDRDPQVRADAPDAVHKMRVATRRLRSVLKTFRPLFDREVTDPVRDALKELGGVLGAARDAEVMRDRLATAIADLDPELVMGPVVRRLQLELDDRYHQALREAVAVLDGAAYLSLLDALDRLVESPPWSAKARKRSGSVLRKRVRAAYDDVVAQIARAEDFVPGPERDHALHEARKAAKRARYAGEAVAARFGRPAEKFAAAMEEIQEVLGEHQDSAVARTTVREVGVRAHLAGENAFAWGALHAVEEQRGRAADAAFRRSWRAASRPRRRRWLSS